MTNQPLMKPDRCNNYAKGSGCLNLVPGNTGVPPNIFGSRLTTEYTITIFRCGELKDTEALPHELPSCTVAFLLQ